MSMADNRDRTSYWINNIVKDHLRKNGCILNRLSKKRGGLFIYQIIDQRGNILAEIDRIRMELDWKRNKLQDYIDQRTIF